MNQTRRMFAASLAALSTMMIRTAARADGVQVVGNHGQIVSTGPVNVRQAAGGEQYLVEYPHGSGEWVAIQGVSNDLQVVSTDAVNVDQSAAGQQTVVRGGYADGGPDDFGTCTAGEWYVDGSCVYFCGDDCLWRAHCCDACPKCPKQKKGCCH